MENRKKLNTEEDKGSTTQNIVKTLKRSREDNEQATQNKKGKTESPKQNVKQDYNDFLAAILDLQRKKIEGERKNIDTIAMSASFIASYFKKNKTFIWPGNEQKLHIAAARNGEVTTVSIKINSQTESKPLLKLTVQPSMLKVDEVNTNDVWTANDVRDLVNLFSFAAEAKPTYVEKTAQYAETIALDSEDDKAESIDKMEADIVSVDEKVAPVTESKNENWFESKDELIALQKKYAARNCHSVLPHFLMNHTVKDEDQYVFWLDWQSKNIAKAELKCCISSVRISDNKNYHSWVFAEDEYQSQNEYKKQKIENFHVQVFETGAAPKTVIVKEKGKTIEKQIEKPILDMWFSPDGAYGELREIEKLGKLPGGDIMELYEILEAVLGLCEGKSEIKTCDSSAETKMDERHENQIVYLPFRDIAGIGSWYTEYGFETFDFENVKVGYPELKGYDVISQNVKLHRESVKRLRETDLSTLREYFQEKETQLQALPDKLPPNKLIDKTELKRQAEENKLLKKIEPKRTACLDDLLTRYEAKTLGELAEKVFNNHRKALEDLRNEPNNEEVKAKKAKAREDMHKAYQLMRLPFSYTGHPDHGKIIKPQKMEDTSKVPIEKQNHFQLLHHSLLTKFMRRNSKTKAALEKKRKLRAQPKQTNAAEVNMQVESANSRLKFS